MGDAEIKCVLDWPAGSQSLVEADTEPDRGPVAHGLPHPDYVGKLRRHGTGEQLGTACIYDDALHAPADRLEQPYQAIHGDDLGISVVVFCCEASVRASSVSGEMDDARLGIKQSLADIRRSHGRADAEVNVVSFPACLDGLLDLAQRRAALLDWARRTGGVIIEDDYAQIAAVLIGLTVLDRVFGPAPIRSLCCGTRVLSGVWFWHARVPPAGLWPDRTALPDRAQSAWRGRVQMGCAVVSLKGSCLHDAALRWAAGGPHN